MEEAQIGKLQKIAQMTAAFSPAAPVNDRSLFSYRDSEIGKCFSAVFQRGLHIALFGERGVGKTSLANVLPKILTAVNVDGLRGFRIDCNSGDTYTSLWSQVFREVGIDAFEGTDPEDVRRALSTIVGKTLIVIDELDRFEDDEGLSLLADTIKTLSDHSVDVTLMLVGVADSLMRLMGEHASITRSIVEVQMPRMSRAELVAIIDLGLEAANARIEDAAKDLIVSLSEGLPHYTHLLTQAAGIRAVQDDRDLISIADVDAILRKTIDTHSFKTEHDRATRSPQPDTLFGPVLLACAYAPRDALGFFRPADVREPLAIILGKPVEIATYQQHLIKFASEERGSVLTREGGSRKYRYRFTNPLLQPYTKIRALAEGQIDDVTRRSLDAARAATRWVDERGQGNLFIE